MALHKVILSAHSCNESCLAPTIAWLLTELKTQTGIRPHAYVDDIVLHGSPETLDAALSQIANAWPAAGLKVNHGKIASLESATARSR